MPSEDIYLFVGLLDFGLGIVPLLIDLVDGGLELLADFLSTHKQKRSSYITETVRWNMRNTWLYLQNVINGQFIATYSEQVNVQVNLFERPLDKRLILYRQFLLLAYVFLR